MIPELIAGAAALGVAASGWIYAYRARGESRDALVETNKANDRERAAGVDRDTASTKAMEADARARAAADQRDAYAVELRGVRAELDAARRERTALYERLASAGAPVGDLLFDDALDRLYAHPDGGSPGAGGGKGALPGSPDDPAALPPIPAAPPGTAR